MTKKEKAEIESHFSRIVENFARDLINYHAYDHGQGIKFTTRNCEPDYPMRKKWVIREMMMVLDPEQRKKIK